jgi:hypothetical protein
MIVKYISRILRAYLLMSFLPALKQLHDNAYGICISKEKSGIFSNSNDNS